MRGAADAVREARASLAPIEVVLTLADSALVLGQRNAEWCGHGPVLEEDIAMANLSLDLIGQARALYQLAAARIGGGATEDSLAYFREAHEFRHFTLCELPHDVERIASGEAPAEPPASAPRDYAVTIARNFFFGEWMRLVWDALVSSSDDGLAAIAGRASKETRYHCRHARDWLVRLGDGTDESHARMQAAVDALAPYTTDFHVAFSALGDVKGPGVSPAFDSVALTAAWRRTVDDGLAEATLSWPSDRRASRTARSTHGRTAHLASLVAEMQSLARAHPGATW